MYGISLGALGILSTLAIGLTIDGFGPVSDNAGGIAEMCELPPIIRDRTDALDAAGNTTAAVGKGFAIGSAALVALALYGAFITRGANPANNLPITNTNINSPLIFAGLIIGAMLTYPFSALAIEAVQKAATQIATEVSK